MAGVYIEGMAQHYARAQATLSTASSFTVTLPTTARPAASATKAVLDRQRGEQLGTVRIIPYGVATNNQTGNIKLLGWNRNVQGNLYVPQLICELGIIFSSALPGIDAEQVDTTMLLPDTLSLTNGIATMTQGTADVDLASFLADVSGFELLEIQYKVGTCTSLGSLIRYQ